MGSYPFVIKRYHRRVYVTSELLQLPQSIVNTHHYFKIMVFLRTENCLSVLLYTHIYNMVINKHIYDCTIQIDNWVLQSPLYQCVQLKHFILRKHP